MERQWAAAGSRRAPKGARSALGSTRVVGVAPSTRSWAGRLARYCRVSVGDLVVIVLGRRQRALVGGCDVVIVDDDSSFASPAYVADLASRGIGVVGVFDPGDGEGQGRRVLERIGVGAVVPHDVEPGELVGRIRAVAAAAGAPSGLDDGTVVGVGGPSRSGCTDVAIELSQDARGVLIDLDCRAPTIGSRLGLAPSPGLLDAVAVARGADDDRGRRLVDCVARRNRPADSGYDVIVNGAVTSSGAVLGCDVDDLLRAARLVWPSTMARLGPLGTRSGEPAASALAVVDQLVAVTDASPLGLVRLRDWLAVAAIHLGAKPIHVVLNRRSEGEMWHLGKEPSPLGEALREGGAWVEGVHRSAATVAAALVRLRRG